MSDKDIAIAMVIAMVILVIAVCVWPGFARVNSKDLAGYWLSERGTPPHLYEIRSGPGRTFVVEKPGSEITLSGVATQIRHIEIPGLEKEGSLELGGRHINWNGGDVWVRQGIRM